MCLSCAVVPETSEQQDTAFSKLLHVSTHILKCSGYLLTDFLFYPILSDINPNVN
jgi:hypothetical protein